MERSKAGDGGFGSDVLLGAYQLLIETAFDSDTDEALLQRGLAILAAVPWPTPHRFFSALLPAPDGGSLRLAAVSVVGGAPPPACVDHAASACLCGRALLLQDRLISVAALPPPELPPCDPEGAGLHLILPLAARGRVLGVLHTLADPANPPGVQERTFLVQVATLLGAELHRRKSEREHDRLEMQFLQAQKMEAVGRLAGGVAHDFNNILTTITNYADLGLLKLPPGTPLRRNFEEIIAAADRAALLTQQLLAFSRRQVLAPRVIDVNAVVGELFKTLRRLLGADIDFSISPAPEPARILADPALIEQLVINLTVSARDAMPRGGAIAVSTSTVPVDAGYTIDHPAVAPGTYVCLAISANGPGMSAAHLDTLGAAAGAPAPQLPGSTLGPAAVSDIVQQGGGHLVVDTSTDGGRTVRICFPCASAAEQRPQPLEGALHLPRGSETILLAEDNDSVRVVIAEVLRDLGYEVLEAREGLEALALGEGHQGGIDALLADWVMPGLSGRETRRRLASTHLKLRVLYISGAMDEPIVPDQLDAEDAVFLRKPFSPWSLAVRLRQVLDAPATAR